MAVAVVSDVDQTPRETPVEVATAEAPNESDLETLPASVARWAMSHSVGDLDLFSSFVNEVRTAADVMRQPIPLGQPEGGLSGSRRSGSNWLDGLTRPMEKKYSH